MIERVIRAARLEPGLFTEVMNDETATTQAILVMIIASVAAGLGTALGLLFLPFAFVGFFVQTLIVSTVLGVVVFFAWVWATQWVGARFFNARVIPYMSFLRPTGFAFAPRIAAILSFIPVLGGLIGLAAGIWALVAMIVAVREALSLSTGNAIAAGLIAGIAIAVVMAILSPLLIPLGGRFY